ncbi:MAG: GntR family transcriptional regulator [Gammaproteobacteria bacterium]|nr:GntR family transcriptional regulator [Gammaproteobacteria bacterium]
MTRLPVTSFRRAHGSFSFRPCRSTSPTRKVRNIREGWLPLRRGIQAHLARSRGVHCDVAQILIVSGSQQGLDLSARVLLDPGDTVVTEDPQYLGAREVFRSLGAELQPVPVDDEGMLTPGVPARLAYVTPSHQFPTGAVLSLRRRLALLAWADRHDAYVIEDDYDSEFRYDGAPLRAIHGLQVSDRVVYLGTFAKVLFPSIRLGYVVVPHALLPAYRGAKWLSDRHSATLEQRALAAFIEGGHFERTVRMSRTRYGERRDALLRGLAQVPGRPFEVSGAATGLHALARVSGLSRGDLERLIGLAADRGVGVYPAEPYYLNPAEAPAALLFGFATIAPDAIREGLALLHEAYRRL